MAGAVCHQARGQYRACLILDYFNAAQERLAGEMERADTFEADLTKTTARADALQARPPRACKQCALHRNSVCNACSRFPFSLFPPMACALTCAGKERSSHQPLPRCFLFADRCFRPLPPPPHLFETHRQAQTTSNTHCFWCVCTHQNLRVQQVQADATATVCLVAILKAQ